MSIGGLRIIDEGDSPDLADMGNAVGGRHKILQALLHSRGRHAEGPGEGGSSEGVGDVMRSSGLNVRDESEFLGRSSALLDERAVDQILVDNTKHGDRRGAEGEANCSAAFDDVGVLDHLECHRVLDVEDHGLLRALEHSCLGGDVRLHRAEMIDVIIGNVQAHRRDGTNGVNEGQLRSTDFNGDHVEIVVHDDIDKRVANIARRGCAVARGAQHRLEHQRRGRLAIRAGDGQPGGSVVGVTQAPREFKLTPHRNTAIKCIDDDGGIRAKTG